jgi:hypothetical protein
MSAIQTLSGRGVALRDGFGHSSPGPSSRQECRRSKGRQTPGSRPSCPGQSVAAYRAVSCEVSGPSLGPPTFLSAPGARRGTRLPLNGGCPGIRPCPPEVRAQGGQSAADVGIPHPYPGADRNVGGPKAGKRRAEASGLSTAWSAGMRTLASPSAAGVGTRRPVQAHYSAPPLGALRMRRASRAGARRAGDPAVRFGPDARRMPFSPPQPRGRTAP